MAKAGRGLAAAGAALTLLAACGSNARSSSAPPPRPAGAVLRGTVSDSFNCPPSGGGASSTVSTSAVTALLVCGREGKEDVTLSPGDRRFAPLVSALSEADLPRQSGPCPLYADVVQPVLARTASQVLVVHVPVDGCGHYRTEARAALRSVTAG